MTRAFAPAAGLRRAMSTFVSVPTLMLLSALAGCADPVPVSFRVVTSPDDDPLLGATSLRVVVTRSQLQVSVAEAPLTSGLPPLPEIPFGDNYRLRVEALDHDVVLARGSSFPFAVGPSGASIVPDVLIGRVGRFAAVPADPATTRPDSSIAAAFATSSGALLVTELGTVYAYRQHPSVAEPRALVVLAHLPSRDGATWCVLPGVGLLGVGGAVAGATVLDASGEVIATSLDAALGRHRDGATSIAVPGDTPVALVLGGAPGALDPPSGAVTRLELQPGGPPDSRLMVTSLAAAELPTPSARAGAAIVQVDVGGVEVSRVVLAGGVGEFGATGLAVLVDPEGEAPSLELALGGESLRDSVVVSLSPRLVLLAGGAADDGIPSDAVRLLSAEATGLSVVAPPSLPLVVARADAGAFMLAEGLVLIAGGTGPSGAALSSAELRLVDLRHFPGDPLPTGSLPWPQSAPRLVALGDGTVLSADASGLAFYVPAVDVL